MGEEERGSSSSPKSVVVTPEVKELVEMSLRMLLLYVVGCCWMLLFYWVCGVRLFGC